MDSREEHTSAALVHMDALHPVQHTPLTVAGVFPPADRGGAVLEVSSG